MRIDESWLVEWTADRPWPSSEEGLQCLRDRPRVLYPLMIAFPPSCVVRTRPGVSLRVPRPNTHGIVQSWFKPSEEDPHGLVGVIQGPDGDVRAQCLPEQLEVVGYWCGWTHARVRSVLEGGGI